MPRINPELRARQCQFTYSDGRRCRLARTATGEGYCYSHARKIREQRELEGLLDYLTQPLAHPAIASTSITHVLVRLFGIVASGRLPAKTSNALLRIAQTLHRTLPGTEHEFGQVFDHRGLTATVRTLYDEQDRTDLAESSLRASLARTTFSIIPSRICRLGKSP